MLKIAVCIGSSCHIKGSRQVIQTLERLICEKGLTEQVELSGSFCMGSCQRGVCVSLGDEVFSVSPEEAEDFFEKTVLPILKRN